jgi:hypothetical protein
MEKNGVAGKINIFTGIIMVVYYVVMMVLTALGVYVPKNNEGWEGLGYAVGLVFLIILLGAGILLGLANCIFSAIVGKKLVGSMETGKVPKVLMIFNGIFKLFNLFIMIFVIIFLATFPAGLPYIIATLLMLVLVVVSIVFDCMVRGGKPKAQEEEPTDRTDEYPESYGFN